MNKSSSLYEAIEQAIINPCAREMAGLPDKKRRFSSKYRSMVNSIDAMEDEVYKRPCRLRKIKSYIKFAIVAAIIMSMMIGSTPATAGNDSDTVFLQMEVVVKGNSADVNIINVNDENRVFDETYVYREPTLIPPGYKRIVNLDYGIIRSITYYKDRQNFIVYEQSSYAAHSDGIGAHIGHSTYLKATLDDRTVFICYNEFGSMIVWFDEKSTYCLSSTTNLNDLIEVYRSVSPVE